MVHIFVHLCVDIAMYIQMHDDNQAICMMITHLYASICIYMMILQLLSPYIYIYI